MSNFIAEENQKQGTPQSIWDVRSFYNSNIVGFTNDISVNINGVVDFKINTDATDYRIDIYRLGYYGGDGARLVASLSHHNDVPIVQPAPLTDPSTGLVDAGNWATTDSWDLPADIVSGVYVANLIRTDGTQGASQIPFIVRNDESHSDIVFQTADPTWQAYNGWGGSSYYAEDGSAPSVAVSYNRPFEPQPGFPYNTVLDAEYNAIRWLEKNGYEVSYIAGVDTARFGHLLLNHKVYMNVGHDEYWSAEQRDAVEAARDAGVHLQFWSGNDMFWKTRWAPSIDESATDYRTLISYKWVQGVDQTGIWTGTWANPNQPGGPDPQNALTGNLFQVNAYRSDTISVPTEFSQNRFWTNTSIAELGPGEVATLGPGTLGHEWNTDPDNGFRPAGLIHLSSTTLWIENGYSSTDTLTLGSGEATHNLTLYRAPSGALVFGAGTVFWSWNLDGPAANHDAQQAMINLFADMGVQPASLAAGLMAAEQSTDFNAPVAAITSAVPFVLGEPMTFNGTAADESGMVASVEVSTDGGQSWHRANGTSIWSYSWLPDRPGTFTLQSRAVDDSLNLQSSTEQVTAQIGTDQSDALYGSRTHNDLLFGGLGNDVYEVSNPGNTVLEVAQGGSDSIWSYSEWYVLPQNVEGLVLGTSAVSGQGNDLNNVIVGNDNANALLGGSGADLLIGGRGNDDYEVDDAGDTVFEALGEGSDTVFAYVDYALPENVEGLVMSYGVQTYGIGNAEHNEIIGNSLPNVIEGGTGYDVLTGGDGSDLFLIQPTWGVDEITDFTPGGGTPDALIFDDRLFTSFADVIAHAAQVGDDIWIGDGVDNTVVLRNVDLAALRPDDFGFWL